MVDALAWSTSDAADRLSLVRKVCLSLPEVTERASHGGPAFFIREKKTFVMFLDDHHGDGRLAIWCAAPEGFQEDVIHRDPFRFFRPPYVGHRGWVGVNLLGIDRPQLEDLVMEAYRVVARAALVRKLDAEP